MNSNENIEIRKVSEEEKRIFERRKSFQSRCEHGFLGYVTGDISCSGNWSDVTAVTLASICGLRPRFERTGFSNHFDDCDEGKWIPMLTEDGIVSCWNGYYEDWPYNFCWISYTYHYDDSDIFKPDQIMDFLSRWYLDGMFTRNNRHKKMESSLTEIIRKHAADCGLIENKRVRNSGSFNDDSILYRIFPQACYISAMMAEGSEDSREKVLEKMVSIGHALTGLTDSSSASILAGDIYTLLFHHILCGVRKEKLLEAVFTDIQLYGKSHTGYVAHVINQYGHLFGKDFPKQEQPLKSGCRVIHTLTQVMECFISGSSYKKCMEMALRKYREKPVVCALAGSLASAYYLELPDKYKVMIHSPAARSPLQEYDGWGKPVVRGVLETYAITFGNEVGGYFMEKLKENCGEC